MLVVIGILIKIGLVVGISQGAVAYLIYVERKVAAYAQAGSSASPSACSSRWPTGPRCCSRRTWSRLT
jgi:NADH-quinone oxidoreductase subunit H